MTSDRLSKQPIAPHDILVPNLVKKPLTNFQRERGDRVRCTHRDIQIMESIYRSGGMWREDALAFYESESYGKRRLWQMVKEQMLERRGVWRNGRRVSKYFIKIKGKRELIKAGVDVPEDIQMIEEPKKKRNRKREWTERDMEILLELYRMRAIKLEQILEKWFEESKGYGKIRLGVMKKEWLVTSKRTRTNGRNEALYRITERGVRLLIERGALEENEVVRARDLEFSPMQRDVMLEAGELRFALPDIPYLDSRTFKRRHEMNRSELVLGGFELPDGDCALYIVRDNPKEQTIQRLVREIGAPKANISRYLVLHKSNKNPFESIRWSTGGKPVHVLPLNEQGVTILRELVFGDRLAELVGEYGELCTAPENRWRFRHVLKTSAGERFAVEALTGDTVLLERALREYRDTRTKIVLFLWEEDMTTLERVKGASWIEVVSIPRGRLQQKTF